MSITKCNFYLKNLLENWRRPLIRTVCYTHRLYYFENFVSHAPCEHFRARHRFYFRRPVLPKYAPSSEHVRVILRIYIFTLRSCKRSPSDGACSRHENSD